MRHDSTATSTIALMIHAPPGMPIVASAVVKGEIPGTIAVHGTVATISPIDST